MTSVHDVAAYILQKTGPMSAMKLQKLVYYAQAWHLVWEERPLFDAPIEAWANGPVCRALYARHRGRFVVDEWDGDPDALDAADRTTLDAVLDFYGKRSAHELSELTHREAPWHDARENLPTGARSDVVITAAAMHEFYDGLITTSS